MEEIITEILVLIEFVLIVLCVVDFLTRVRKYTDEQMANRILRVTCRKCGKTFEGTQNSLKMGIMHKETSSTKTKIKGGAMVNEPEYGSYARKVYCPYCQSMEWADIHDVNEIAETNRKAVRPYLIRLIVRLIAINLAFGLLHKIVSAIF
ncbi:MAG: hypothetical protein SOI56_10105 [Eubacteriales bacterium]|jgi:ribosomal protein L44E